MSKIDEIRERAKEEGNGIFRKSSVLILLAEIDRLNASVNYLLERIRLTKKVEQVNDDLRRRNIDLEATIASLRAELNQKNLDVFGG